MNLELGLQQWQASVHTTDLIRPTAADYPSLPALLSQLRRLRAPKKNHQYFCLEWLCSKISKNLRDSHLEKLEAWIVVI